MLSFRTTRVERHETEEKVPIAYSTEDDSGAQNKETMRVEDNLVGNLMHK